ncbi:collectin-12 [Plakobranchus ocellatus]|uniref:Collectin-12 n=1 Tax=Plakobranchus ocellatus TaxID=259542 RepID=A0AAV3ZUE4_9GAST|nr:collectin-12 [Plakobranchus ocellatus]
MKSILEEYECGKARLLTILEEYDDPVVKTVQPSLKTGRKWKVTEAVDEAKECLKMKEVISQTQTDRRGLGSTTAKWCDVFSVIPVLRICFSTSVQLKSKSGAYWIGLSDQHKEGRWRWLNGNNTVIYKKWAPGQPSNHQVLGHKKGQDCGEVGRYKLGQWNDHDCITAQKFICEKPAKNANQSVGVLIGIIIAAILVLCGAIIAGILFGPKLYRAARERMEKKMDSAIGVTNTIAQSM